MYRIRPDGSDKEYMGHILHHIVLNAEGEWVYAAQATDEILGNIDPVTNLIRWNPESGEIITLFRGGILPEIENAHSIWYQVTESNNENVFFTVGVVTSEAFEFQNDYSNVFTAEFKVDKNGDNLTLLNGEHTEPVNFAATERINNELPYFTFRFQGETVTPLRQDEFRLWLGFPDSGIHDITITDENGYLNEYVNGEITLVRRQEIWMHVTWHGEHDGEHIYEIVFHYSVWDLIDGEMILVDEWTEEVYAY